MKQGKWTTILLVLALLAGLGLLLYPSVSDYWNALHQSRAIAQYAEQVAELDNQRYEELWAAAERYNLALGTREARYEMTAAEQAEYDAVLNVLGDGAMGYVEIPSIQCTLPIYHGTSEAVLQIAAGHIAGTSLPVGGEGSHCALSGHRGLPSARLFTDLDQVDRGDEFFLHILDETLTYEVDQIRIVEPDEVEALEIERGKDYCTLITCTPYGVNSHRLLVRGHRVENREAAGAVRVTADAIQIEPVIAAPLVAAPMLLLLLAVLLIPRRPKKKIGGTADEDP